MLLEMASCTNASFSRRSFLSTLISGAAGLSLPTPLSSRGANEESFAFGLLGDLHFDRLKHHELEWLEREKPDDLRQVRDYSRITADILPQLFARLRETLAELSSSPNRLAFLIQVGDLVEGLCGNENLARQQNTEAVEFLRATGPDVPLLFTKGNHDVTGAGAPEAFKAVFHPFLGAQAAQLKGPEKLTSARYTVQQGEALFCFYDAYDKESLGWLEAALARRTARHCFLVIHPPVVPYGARSTWHIFSGEREKVQRGHLLELLGKHNVLVLSGHIHKFNLLARTTPGGGKFLQVALSSVISSAPVQPRSLLSGVSQYTPDQVKVEAAFSPATEQARRAVYESERDLVRYFQYADLPGYAIVKVNGPHVTLDMYSGFTSQLWRTVDLTQVLAG
ncbi:MAG TPA: metallophosphoesterase [Verrucomicrobiae bacterium]